MNALNELQAKLEEEADNFHKVVRAIREQKKRCTQYKREEEKERRKELKEAAYYRPPGGVAIYSMGILEIEGEAMRRTRKKFFWNNREYLYTSGKPYDLVDLFNIGERDAK